MTHSVLDNNGNPQSQRLFYEQGNWTDPHNHYLLNGKEWDEEMALTYFGARYYDAVTGVWLTQDSYRGEPAQPLSLHRTLYVAANPVNNVDAYGYKLEAFANGYGGSGGGVTPVNPTNPAPPNPATQDNPPIHWDDPVSEKMNRREQQLTTGDTGSTWQSKNDDIGLMSSFVNHRISSPYNERGYLESLADPFRPDQFGAWAQTIIENNPEVNSIYGAALEELRTGEYRGGTVTNFYEDTFQMSREVLSSTYPYTTSANLDLEAAHISLLVLGSITELDQADWRDYYPVFIPDGRQVEVGFDKTGHLFKSAFFAFEEAYTDPFPDVWGYMGASIALSQGAESGYNDEYSMGVVRDYLGDSYYGTRNPYFQLSSSATVARRFPGMNALEEDYQNNTRGVPPVQPPGDFTERELVIYEDIVAVTNAYEALSSFEEFRDFNEGELSARTVERICTRYNTNPGACPNYDHPDSQAFHVPTQPSTIGLFARDVGLVDELLNVPKSPERNHGLTDAGVYRDINANRIGAVFGLQVYQNPGSIPSIPYDNYPLYHRDSLQNWMNGNIGFPEMYDEWDPTPMP